MRAGSRNAGFLSVPITAKRTFFPGCREVSILPAAGENCLQSEDRISYCFASGSLVRKIWWANCFALKGTSGYR